MKRRDFIKRLLHYLSIISVVQLPNVYAKTPSEYLIESMVFSAFIDTLIPEDVTPSATQLSMDKKLISHAQNIENYIKLIHLGCQWIDTKSKIRFSKPFILLNNHQQEVIVQLAEDSVTHSIPKMFFDRIRADLFWLYYAEPSAWGGLKFNSPPQPLGYRDYTMPNINIPNG